jgi:hypothetical protein
MKQARSVTISLNDFTGGEAAIFSPTKMPPKYSLLLQNAYVTKAGKIAKIPGYEAVNEASCGVTLKTGFEFRRSDGTVILLCAGGGSVFKLAATALTAIKTGLNATAKVFFSQMNDYCIFGNGVNAPQKYHGSYRFLQFTSGGTYEPQIDDTLTGHTGAATAIIVAIKVTSGTWAGGDAAGEFIVKTQTGTFEAEDLDVGANLNIASIAGDSTYVAPLLGTPPAKGRFPWNHKARIWWTDETDYLMAFHSALQDQQDYETAINAGYLDFKPLLPKGDKLLQISTYIDLIIYLFKNYIAIFSGTNPTSEGDFSLIQLINGTGIPDADAVGSYGSDLAFINQSGIKNLRQVVATGNMDINDLSELIDPTIRAQMNAAGFQGNYSIAHCSKLGLVFFLIGTNVWIYNYTWKAWSRMVGADVNGFFATNEGDLYILGTGFLYKFGTTYSFAGGDVEWKWTLAHIAAKGGTRIFPKIMEIISTPVAEAITLQYQLKYDLRESALEHYGSLSNSEIYNVTEIDGVTDFDAINPLDETATYNLTRIALFGAGRNFEITFSNTSTKGPIEISDISIQAVEGK